VCSEAVKADRTGGASLGVTLRLLYRLPADVLGEFQDGSVTLRLLH
jgi:hypothetical protein